MSAAIFAGVIATQEFALGLSQLGTDGSNPSPSSGESGASLIFGGELAESLLVLFEPQTLQPVAIANAE
jgi:hypothetical protein